ncbi:MAG: hypothetical protein Q9221_003486 [Calogaya cf. arnoldii]
MFSSRPRYHITFERGKMVRIPYSKLASANNHLRLENKALRNQFNALVPVYMHLRESHHRLSHHAAELDEHCTDLEEHYMALEEELERRERERLIVKGRNRELRERCFEGERRYGDLSGEFELLEGELRERRERGHWRQEDYLTRQNYQGY